VACTGGRAGLCEVRLHSILRTVAADCRGVLDLGRVVSAEQLEGGCGGAVVFCLHLEGTQRLFAKVLIIRGTDVGPCRGGEEADTGNTSERGHTEGGTLESCLERLEL